MKTIFKEVASSTVTLVEEDGSHRGQGVFIGSNMILTAGHCIQHSVTGGMAQGDVYLDRIKFHEKLF